MSKFSAKASRALNGARTRGDGIRAMDDETLAEQLEHIANFGSGLSKEFFFKWLHEEVPKE